MALVAPKKYANVRLRTSPSRRLVMVPSPTRPAERTSPGDGGSASVGEWGAATAGAVGSEGFIVAKPAYHTMWSCLPREECSIGRGARRSDLRL